jgi:hypothetical protein
VVAFSTSMRSITHAETSNVSLVAGDPHYSLVALVPRLRMEPSCEGTYPNLLHSEDQIPNPSPSNLLGERT